jgi:hypothetical protein
MNGSVKCVENYGRINGYMHVKCKFVVIVVWNNFVRIKFHFYHLAAILWGIFLGFFYNNENFFYNLYCYNIDESV